MSCVGRWSWRWEALCIVCKWLLLSSSLCLAGVYLSAGGGIGSESLNHPRCLLSITTKKKKDHLIPHFTHRWCFFFGQLSAASCYKSLGISSYCVGGKPCIISDWWLAPLTPPPQEEADDLRLLLSADFTADPLSVSANHQLAAKANRAQSGTLCSVNDFSRSRPHLVLSLILFYFSSVYVLFFSQAVNIKR